uniref:Cytochrome b6-f complex subunit PetP n=1 Tax=Platysiphonia delicata TaxID=2006979 RepID=A0A1Z1M0M3_9FLOR|nr:hypothetical protein [Platysiphonia delicata]ARW59616.1 hypothetical protein [Platysiphonia delicata]
MKAQKIKVYKIPLKIKLKFILHLKKNLSLVGYKKIKKNS